MSDISRPMDSIRARAQGVLDTPSDPMMQLPPVKALAGTVRDLANALDALSARLEAHERDICQHIAPADTSDHPELPVIHNPNPGE